MSMGKYRFLIFLTVCLVALFVTGCGFDDPYVPENAGSSTLTGRILTTPAMDLNGIDIILRGEDSFATVTDLSGRFYFKDIPPGNYSLEMQKVPYLRESQDVTISKSTDENMGDISTKLAGAIAGTIPKDKISIIHGEFDIVVYVNGVPRVLEQDNSGDFVINLSSSESNINIRTVTKTRIFIDGIQYYAKVLDEGKFIVEFVPPGIYTDIRVKLSSSDDTLPIFTGSPIEVKSGQTRVLPSGS